MVTIDVLGRTASVTDGEWHCDDPVVLEAIRSAANLPGHQAHGGHPSPDTYAAEAVAAFLGGHVVSIVEDEDGDSPLQGAQ
jgi:hypothetical protein